jgi:hypothetical protein
MIAISTAAFALSGHADNKSPPSGNRHGSRGVQHLGHRAGLRQLRSLSGASVDAASTLTATCTAGSGFTIA